MVSVSEDATPLPLAAAEASTRSALVVEELAKAFGPTQALRSCSFSVPGEVVRRSWARTDRARARS